MTLTGLPLADTAEDIVTAQPSGDHKVTALCHGCFVGKQVGWDSKKQRGHPILSQGANTGPLPEYLLSISPGPVPGAGVPMLEAPTRSSL